MEAGNICNFDHISDDILLQILLLVPRRYWNQTRNVCRRFWNICNDKTMFRVSYLESAYGMSSQTLTDYLRSGSEYIQVLNLNHCHWFSSTLLSTQIPRCTNIQHLQLLDCRLTTKGLARILCSIDCMKTLVISVSNLLDFSNEINCNQAVQASLRNLHHFGLHIREEPSANAPHSIQFHLSQQTTIIEYCPHLESFCVIGQPGTNQKLSKRLIHPLIVKRENMSNLKMMSINFTNDATARLYFFGILIVAFEVGVHFDNLSVSGLDLKQAVKKSYFMRSLQESCPTLRNLDLSKVHIDDLEAPVPIDSAPLIRYLNLSDVRSESSCSELMKVAHRCPNLVSLNMRGATSGHRNWHKEDVLNFRSLLEVLPNLRHINLSGIHVHNPEAGLSLPELLADFGNKNLESIALSTCCLLSSGTKGQTPKTSLARGPAKRMRITYQPKPSTSREDGSSSMSGCGFARLTEACPNVTSLEIINSGFMQSVVQPSHKTVYDPCKASFSLVSYEHLVPISNWTKLRYLQLTGLPGVYIEKALQQVAKTCVHLERLSLAYIGLGAQSPLVWQSVQCCKQLLDLRIEQPFVKLDEAFFNSCLGCSKLQRLCIVSKNARLEAKVVESFVAKAENLYLIQLFTDAFLKDCHQLQSTLQKRYEALRPGFLATCNQLQHERLSQIISDMPLNHLEDMTLLTSQICAKPIDHLV